MSFTKEFYQLMHIVFNTIDLECHFPVPHHFWVLFFRSNLTFQALDELWQALQCLPMQGWVVWVMKGYLSSSNLKLFLVWTQLCQDVSSCWKLFFASSLYFLTAHHLTGCNDMPWPSHWRMHWQCIWHCMWFLWGIWRNRRRKRKQTFYIKVQRREVGIIVRCSQ